jgi:hypothetical protein
LHLATFLHISSAMTVDLEANAKELAMVAMTGIS